MLVKESFFRDIMRLIIWFPFRWLIHVLPVPASLFIYRRMGDIHFYLSKKKRILIRTNILKALNNMDSTRITKVVRRAMQTHYIDRLVIFLFHRLNKNNIKKYISIEGLKFLDSALRKNRGCILLHSHFGPAQLSLFALAFKGYKMNQLGFREAGDTSYIGREVQMKTRLKIEEGKIPANMLYVNQFMRPVFAALKNNEVLMMPGDGVGGNKFIGKYTTASFFDRKMRFPLGWLNLAKKSGASVIPLSMYQEGGSKYRIIINPPIPLSDGKNYSKDNSTAIQEFISILERDIKKQPHMWHFWDEFYEGNLLVN